MAHNVWGVAEPGGHNRQQGGRHVLAGGDGLLAHAHVAPGRLHRQALCRAPPAPLLQAMKQRLDSECLTLYSICKKIRGNLNTNCLGQQCTFSPISHSMRAVVCAELAMHTRRGLAILRLPVPSLLYMSSALPALGKHSTRHLHILHSAAPIRGKPFSRLY